MHNSRVFKEVASIIGEEEAERELNRLSEEDIEFISSDKACALRTAFSWGRSPQGHVFWKNIQIKIDPNW